jgi:hypothetical protein
MPVACKEDSVLIVYNLVALSRAVVLSKVCSIHAALPLCIFSKLERTLVICVKTGTRPLLYCYHHHPANIKKNVPTRASPSDSSPPPRPNKSPPNTNPSGSNNRHPLPDARLRGRPPHASPSTAQNQIPRPITRVRSHARYHRAMYQRIIGHIPRLAARQRPADGLPSPVGLQVHASEGEVLHYLPG